MQTSYKTPAGWEAALEQMEIEGGVLELSPLREPDDADGGGSAEGGGARGGTRAGWPSRLLKLEATTLVVEAPPRSGVGSADGAEKDSGGPEQLKLTMRMGQRRWALRCRVIERLRFPLNAKREIAALRLSWPEQVDDAQRRKHFRISTAVSTIPAVKFWGVKDLQACVAYEQHNRRRHVEPAGSVPGEDEAPPWPGVRPKWRGLIVNVSGGGLCVALPREAEAQVQEGALLWTKLPLPELEEPLYAVTRAVRCEAQSKKVLQAGLAFSFEHHPRHERFITDQMCYYASYLQRLQLQRERGGRTAADYE